LNLTFIPSYLEPETLTFVTLGVTSGGTNYLGGFGITKPTDVLNVELDVEKRIQAEVLKRQVRIKEFFHDFDRLRKGTVGEAGVRIAMFDLNFSSGHALER
jgi:hypothetical protein